MTQTKLLIAISVLCVVLLSSGCGKKEETTTAPESTTPAVPVPSTASAPAALPAGLKITDIKVGTGAEAVANSKVKIEYTGKLDNGHVFDATSRHNNEPLEFTVGVQQVIPGMDQGVLGMKVGGTRDITIPPDLGYGEDDMGEIPPNSTLHFKIKLVSVE